MKIEVVQHLKKLGFDRTVQYYEVNYTIIPLDTGRSNFKQIRPGT